MGVRDLGGVRRVECGGRGGGGKSGVAWGEEWCGVVGCGVVGGKARQGKAK